MVKKATKGNVISVDFTGVEKGTGGRLLPEGPHQFEIVEIEEKEGADSGKPYLAVTLEVVDGEYAGTKAWDNVSLAPSALWKLMGLLEAAGIETVQDRMDIAYDDVIGRVVIGEVIHEEYKGKTKHRINGYQPSDEALEQEEEEAPPAKPAKAAAGPKKKAAPAPVEEEEEEVEDEAEFSVKQKVKFVDGKKTYSGVITAIDGEMATVKVGKDEYEISFDELEPA